MELKLIGDNKMILALDSTEKPRGILQYTSLVKGLIPLLNDFYTNVKIIKLLDEGITLDTESYSKVKDVENSLNIVILFQELIARLDESEYSSTMKIMLTSTFSDEQLIELYTMIEKAKKNVYKPLIRLLKHEDAFETLYCELKEFYNKLSACNEQWLHFISQRVGIVIDETN